MQKAKCKMQNAKCGASQPPLSDEQLTQLRELVVSLHEGNGGRAPHESFVSLASTVEPPHRVTVDFRASERLNLPMVVLQLAPAEEIDARFLALSPRERDVAALVAQGLGNKQIAAQLGIALCTVKDHVHRILEKTGLPNRAAIALLAAGRGPLSKE